MGLPPKPSCPSCIAQACSPGHRSGCPRAFASHSPGPLPVHKFHLPQAAAPWPECPGAAWKGGRRGGAALNYWAWGWGKIGGEVPQPPLHRGQSCGQSLTFHQLSCHPDLFSSLLLPEVTSQMNYLHSGHLWLCILGNTAADSMRLPVLAKVIHPKNGCVSQAGPNSLPT